MCRDAYNSAGVGDNVPMHYSYDFAQQVHYPNNPLQPGPAYFLTARKCQIFGVSCEPLGWQVNYMIDEADVVGKGANITISLLHHFLQHRALPSEVLFLHADNCVGQNKNNATMHYLEWRVFSGQQRSITITFMISGHTKFAPDRHFGLIKKTHVQTMGCLEHVMRNSSHIGANEVQLVRSSEGSQLVKFYNWSVFFQSYFTTIPGITSYHSFRFNSESPGIVFLHKNLGEEETALNIFCKAVPGTLFPEEIIPKGMDAQRQWYLYDKIRPFCTSTLSKDVTCPLPTIPRPTTPSSRQTAPSTGKCQASSSGQSSAKK